MNKCLMALLLVGGLIACTKKDEQYYQLHPEKLQEAIKACPGQQPQGLSCGQLQKFAVRMSRLAYQLQQSPQGFGSRILTLQETIAQQQQQLKTEANNTQLQAKITQNQQDLAEHLAVVRWLESPAS